MSLSRRQFLQAASVAALASAGCDAVKLPSMPYVPGLTTKEQGPITAPTDARVDDTGHVIARLTFGTAPGDYERIKTIGPAAFIDEQLHPERIDDRPCEWRVRRLETLRAPTGELFEYKKAFLLEELTAATVLRAVYSRRQLHEVMVDFWSDHFNIDSSKGDCKWLKTADDRDVIRAHAMGTFPELLRASALSPAMLWYLDGRVNKKTTAEDHPNENYARELLELHTLGVHGGYTQQDVMEVARCLTGWTVRSDVWFGNGRVEFRPEWHDDGSKVVLGETIPAGLGKGDLDHVLNLVSTHPSTAKHIATKLCTRFIGEAPAAAAIDDVANTFQQSNGDIQSTLRTLFATDAFWTRRNDGFKRPFHFVVSALRASGAECDDVNGLSRYLLRMGHAPFQYPTPDGYPMDAAAWTGSLMWRWHFAMALYENRVDGTNVDWAALRARAGGDDALMRHFLSRKPTAQERYAFEASGAGPALLMASPGFQRC